MYGVNVLVGVFVFDSVMLQGAIGLIDYRRIWAVSKNLTNVNDQYFFCRFLTWIIKPPCLLIYICLYFVALSSFLYIGIINNSWRV